MSTTLPKTTTAATTANASAINPLSVFFMAGKGLAAYVFLQVITGIEVGVVAAAMVLSLGWSLPFALSIAIPLGFPAFLAQGLALFLLMRNR
jgi:hypothetical protein